MSNNIQVLPIYDNWQAFNKNEKSLGAFEVPLFTDAHITGMITEGFGPYQFLNTVPLSDRQNLKPSIILRVENCLQDELPSNYETQEDFYHGGWLADEIASLLSLTIGIRVKAGSICREFSLEGDLRGRPIATQFTPDPILLKNTIGTIIPRAIRTHSLDDLTPLADLCKLTKIEAMALIRSARLYQDALWISESEPNLSWIMFVSAIETAAYHWKNTPEPAFERLEAWKPDLAKWLIVNTNQEVREKIANEIVDVTGATKKFLKFVKEFFPEPPENRPEEWCQHKWTKGKIEKSLGKIYEYRSRALHGGKPFPAPMSFPPMQRDNNSWAEISSGISAGTGVHNWVTEDLPMYLHTFEHIVRQSLLKWWKSMTSSKEQENKEK